MLVLHKCLITFEIIPYNSIYNLVFNYTIYALSVIMMLPFLSSFTTAKGIIPKIITKISLISYSMYLVHLSIVILNIFPHFHIENLLLKYVVYWVLTIFISSLLYKFWEKPTMKLRDKIKIL
jgi:peptidoglycan/LPS O-acetylase OafA/YrhL